MSAHSPLSSTATALHDAALSPVRALLLLSAVSFTGFTSLSAQTSPSAAAYAAPAETSLVAETLPGLAFGPLTERFVPASYRSSSDSLASSPGAADLFTGSPISSSSPAPRSGVGAIRGGGAIPSAQLKPFSTFAVEASVGINGVGVDVATPLARHFNLRVGGGFFSYSDSFVEQGANVDAKLQLHSGHALLDWFPFRSGFRVSPLLVFANNNNARGTVIVPAGSTITLNGSNYISSTTDPLHGSGSIDFRKVAPGLTAGFGNLISRSGKHLSFPVEIGFYYVGQPTLKVAFTGSACDPTVPASIGCESVDQDSDFQKSLAAFKARNNNNLSYASFFPVFSTGVGYRF